MFVVVDIAAVAAVVTIVVVDIVVTVNVVPVIIVIAVDVVIIGSETFLSCLASFFIPAPYTREKNLCTGLGLHPGPQNGKPTLYPRPEALSSSVV